MSGIGNSGGWRAGLQNLLQRGSEALSKVRGGEKGESKGEVKGEAKSGSTGGAGAAKAKGKARGKDMSAVDALLGGTDEFSVSEDEEKERRRKQRFFLGNDDGPRDFVPQDSTAERSAVAHISAEFRGQIASGLTAGRSFTQGSCVVPEQAPDMEDDLDAPPRNRRR